VKYRTDTISFILSLSTQEFMWLVETRQANRVRKGYPNLWKGDKDEEENRSGTTAHGEYPKSNVKLRS